MNYLQWNNCISKYFFNPENSGKDIYLYITKEDIVRIASEGDTTLNTNDAWKDFITAIKTGLPGSTNYKSIIEKARYCFDQWKKPGIKSIQGIPIIYPCYVAYLTFFILPLTEGESFDFHAKDYHGPLKAFLSANNIDQKISSLQELDDLWTDLEQWTIITQNGSQGYFSLGNFSNNYKYVGKPYSQCIFSPNSIKKLPILFSKAELTPDSNYSYGELKDMLISYGYQILGLKRGVIEIIKKYESNELGKAILKIVQNEYQRWNGESHEILSGLKVKKNHTYSRLFLQLKIDNTSGTIGLSYRMRSSNQYPEDLKLDDYFCNEFSNGWSNSLPIKFEETIEVKDNSNKWVARFPRQSIRLFVNGKIHDFNTNYWIETDNLIKTDWMYLLCCNNAKQEILKWKNNFDADCFYEVNLSGIPENYSLFKFKNPFESHSNIELLKFSSNKQIQLTGALQIDYCTYTNDFLPEVVVLNSDGTETVYLEYKEVESTIVLEKKESNSNRWLLPQDIKFDAGFNIKIKSHDLDGYQKTYLITSANECALKVDEKKLVKRNCYGTITNENLNQYCVGSNIINPGKSSQRAFSPWENLYFNKKQDNYVNITTAKYIHHEGNILLSYLTLKGISKAEEFYKAFELLYNKKFQEGIDENINFSKIKKASLNFFDYLGNLDYDYETKDIIVNPPQFIFIPAQTGRRILLIGGRDQALVEAIVQKAPLFNLQVEITPQHFSNSHLLLPDAIIIKSFGTSQQSYGESNLIEFAKELNIHFNERDLLQLSLQHFSAGIQKYDDNIFPELENEDLDWTPYVFDPETLNLTSSGKDFSKEFTLAEYRLRPWEYKHILWKNGQGYKIDKNWGKYLVLKHYKKQEILFDKIQEKVAIPYQLPLPRLLAESIMTLSGLAPAKRRIGNRQYRVYENIPGIFTENLFDKLGQKPQPKEL